MKSKIIKFLTSVLLIVGYSFVSHSEVKTNNSNESSVKRLEEISFSINFKNTPYTDAFQLIAKQLKLKLSLPKEFSGTVNYSFRNVTLKSALDQIARENDLSYTITKDGYLVVSKGWSEASEKRSVASLGANSKAKIIYLKYLTAQDAQTKISSLLTADDKVIIDGPTNSLAFFGSETSFRNVRDAVTLFDKMPPQILIEANVVEINRQDARAFGFSYGDLGDPTLSSVENSSAVIKNNDPSAPNFAVQLGLGKIDGSVLSARLAMAESEGVAKILSSPKIVTINNVGATINSGITYTVKTLASSGSTDSSASVSGGITQVSAGLTLSVRPTIVGTDQIKLNINVTNSEPDNSTLVDGIPGIVNNSTNTEIIVKSGNTASVAGLIKHNNSQSEGGVPYLSKIPLFGWLFKSQTTDSRDKELMIFITPKIIRRDLAGDYMSHSQEMKKHLVPENKDREEEEATSERKDQAKTEGTTRK